MCCVNYISEFVIGTQFDVKDWTRPVAVDPKVPMAQELLKNIGYQTHAVGMVSKSIATSGYLQTKV